MELLSALLALISIHAVIVAAEFTFVKGSTLGGNSQGREVRDRHLVPGDDV